MPPTAIDPEASIDTGLLWIVSAVLWTLFIASFFIDWSRR